MSSIELTPSQRSILTALVNLHGEEGGAIKGEAIAEEVDRNPGTIRNQMQSLKALQLVEGVPGPKGGYKPTAAAYDTLDMQRLDEPASVPIQLDGDPLEGINVAAIDLISVHHPEKCRAEIHAKGSIRDLDEGETLRLGPTPLSKLVIEGVIEGKDETDNVVIISISDMEAPVEESDH